MSLDQKLDAVDRRTIGSAYEVEQLLGEGTYGIVVSARHRVTGARHAIKKIKLNVESDGVPATVIREVTLLQDLNYHPNIVKLLGVMNAQRRLYLVFELLSEDLRSFIRKFRVNPPLPTRGSVVPLPLIKDFARQALHALWSCHNSRILHRDLKPGNILVDKVPNSLTSCDPDAQPKYLFKLADFGLARTYEIPLLTYTNEVMTLWYRPPEILLGEKHYTPAVDIWSVGCIVAEMLVGVSLFRGDSAATQLERIFYTIGTPTLESWPEAFKLPGFSSSIPRYRVAPLPQRLPDFDTSAAEFAEYLLQANPKMRPTTAQALQHPFLADGNGPAP